MLWGLQREQPCSVPIKGTAEDFPGGPVVKTSPSNARGGGSIRGGELRSYVPPEKKKKKKQHTKT